MAAETERDSTEKRYYNLMRLQRSVNLVLEAQVGDGQIDVENAQQTLRREVEKLVRLDANPDIFKAIAAAAWEAPDSAAFARLAKETAAKVRMGMLARKYGTPDAFKKNIEEKISELDKKLRDKEDVEQSIKRLERKLQPIFRFNQKNNVEITLYNKDRIEETSWWDNWESTPCTEAKAMAKKYTKENFGRTPYADMEDLQNCKTELKGLGAQIDALEHEKLLQLAAYKEIKDVTDTLESLGSKNWYKIDLATFQQELCARLEDQNFISCFARNTPAGAGGPVILSALTAQIRQIVQNHLVKYQENVREMTGHLEGPIGILAKNSGQQRPMEGIEEDIRSQALMAGYLCESAAGVFRSVSSFRPDHTEGPVSMKRDLQMHMVVNGGVDAAYIHEVCGMDRLLTKYFNVSARRPEPDFEKVLGSPDAVERVDRRFADFLKENAADKTVQTQGFSAGQFSTESIELFLFNRYFVAAASKADVIKALEKEAAEVKELGDKREQAGISRDGPGIPGLKKG